MSIQVAVVGYEQVSRGEFCGRNLNMIIVNVTSVLEALLVIMWCRNFVAYSLLCASLRIGG